MIKIEDYNFDLPTELIATHPMKPRDRSRLLLLNRKTGKLSHYFFSDLPSLLRPGDLILANNSKVIFARLLGRKMTGGQVEIFLLHPDGQSKNGEIWHCLINGKVTSGQTIFFSQDFSTKFFKSSSFVNLVHFNMGGEKLKKNLKKFGQIPLPPYILKARGAKKPLNQDRFDYQTVFAAKAGSVAAPTAGLHFTKRLLKNLSQKGIIVKYLTLHVGLGTFAPLKEKQLKSGKLHPEWVSIPLDTAQAIMKAKTENRRIIAVGTTTTRALESAPLNGQAFAGWVDLFIYPPYRFKVIDGLITNFHLPKSSLIMLVSALASRRKVLFAYQQAIKLKYRFYSYGDAMLIL